MSVRTEGADGASGGLRRSIGLIQATALVAGIIIGASIFVQPSEIVRDDPTVAESFWYGPRPASSPLPVR